MSRSAALVVSTLLLAAALSGCRSDPALPQGDFTVGDDDEYVAFGDSYTAAPLTGAFDAQDGCVRSTANYPHVVAAATGATLVDVSCSGATSAAIVQPFVTSSGYEVPPQIDALSSTTDLVTVGIGANDTDLIGQVILLCVQAATANSGASPCTDQDAVAGQNSVEQRLGRMKENLVARLERIRDRAPDAEVLVIGYPEMFPESGTCDLLPLAPGDYPFARRVNEGINDALAAAADRVDVEFVDVFTATEGHHICAPDPWVAGAEASRGAATPWHPYGEEQRAVADLILDELS